MSRIKKSTIDVHGTTVTILDKNDQDYISLTDIARYRDSQEPFAIINNWMRGRSTIEFLGLWEKMSNPGFKPLEFERFKNEAGSNYFVLSPQRWIVTTHAIGITSTSGRYGGTYAHKDMLNVALFGKTAKEWRELNPSAEGNIRDQASLEQLVVLSNLESLNSVFIRQGLPQSERLVRLNEIAITQMRSLFSSPALIKRLK